MNLTFKNRDLPYVIQFLDSLKLTGGNSRARMKLAQKVDAKYKEISDDYQNEFMNETEELSEAEKKERKKQEVEFLNESATVNMSEYQDKMVMLTGALNNYPHELSGKDAEIHDLLLDKLEGE